MTLLMRDRENQKIPEICGKIFETISMGKTLIFYHFPEKMNQDCRGNLI